MKKVVYGKDVRRAFKIGQSIAVTLPPKFTSAHGVKPGDELEAVFNDELHFRIIRTDEIKKYFAKKTAENEPTPPVVAEAEPTQDHRAQKHKGVQS